MELLQMAFSQIRFFFKKKKKQQVAVDLASQALSSHYTITPIDSILPLTQRVR